MIVLLLIVLTTSLLYYILKNKYTYWERRGVLGPRPVTVLGNLGQGGYFKKHVAEVWSEIYNQYPEEPLVGVYRYMTPALLIRDPELLKDILIKSFNNFHDNEIFADKDKEPILARSPFFLRGEEWKTVRAQLTPGFTSGRMKKIYSLLQQNCTSMVQYLNSSGTKTCEAKNLSLRFTSSNVANCAFGLDGKCFEEDSEFFKICQDFFKPGAFSTFMFIMSFIFPEIFKVFPIRITPKHVETTIFKMIAETSKHRERVNLTYDDFLQMLIEIKKTSKGDFTDIDVAAHASGFLGDGAETSSIAISYVLYYLSRHPQIQEYLRTEVFTAIEKNDNQLSYEDLQSLPYLDAVVNETLRISPPATVLAKMCTKDYDYQHKGITIKKGTSIIIPVYGIHNDPNHFEDPQVFNPERFLGTNKNSIKKGTFLPFGEGPRTCLGQRFGMLQIKCGVASIIQHYQLTLNDKTKLPLRLDPTALLLSPIGGLWIDFKRIDQSTYHFDHI